MSDAGDPSVEGLTRRDLHGGPRRTWRTWAVVAVVTVLVVVLGGTAYAAWRLNANITKLDVSAAIGTDRPTQAPEAAEAVNILLIGSDTREGAGNDAYADRDGTLGGGAHSDTNLLVHLSADRSSATVVSIPRDSMTLAPPDCSATAPKDEWHMRQWNQNYSIGGPGCLIRTLEGNTGVFIDHYAVVDFRGFKQMVDALGGVRGLHPGGDRRREHPPAAPGRQAHPRRAPGAAVRAGAQVGRRRVRPAAHRAPAGLPVLGDPGGHLDPAAVRAHEALRLPQRRHEVTDDRPGVRCRHDA